MYDLFNRSIQRMKSVLEVSILFCRFGHNGKAEF